MLILPVKFEPGVCSHSIGRMVYSEREGAARRG